ncbi:hypothetical protein A3K63_04220 [Candidatus Micrarchaeota archaeon RBG_16_49_10]|nr:MAG: hypothetical protein A3K63_04220 [Candidatus Micrarchaeota archaeon RBG_16_49_10]
MKLKIPIKPILILLLIALVIWGAWKLYWMTRPVTVAYYKGFPLSFRADLRKAEKVQVQPDEQVIRDMFWDYRLENITILFKPGSTKTNGLYQLEVFELTYKLTIIYKNSPFATFNTKTITAQPIDSYDNITREEGILKVILVPPEYSDETIVKGAGNKVFIYGKTDINFDLAVIKTILVAMGPRVQ